MIMRIKGSENISAAFCKEVYEISKGITKYSCSEEKTRKLIVIMKELNKNDFAASTLTEKLFRRFESPH